jgi:hypothetical protein
MRHASCRTPLDIYNQAVSQQKWDPNARVVEMMLPLEAKKFQDPPRPSEADDLAGQPRQTPPHRDLHLRDAYRRSRSGHLSLLAKRTRSGIGWRSSKKGSTDRRLWRPVLDRRCKCLVFYTSILARNIWKYKTARSYRTLLLDVGHLDQTLLLSAAALGLGATFTAALRDEAVEKILAFDLATELVMGSAVVGTL